MNWKIRGSYKQKKREGYNLLNNNSQFFPALTGLNFDFKKDGSIVCQGTSSSTWNRKRNAGNIYNVESGTYTLYLKVVGSCPNAILNIALEDTDMKTIVSSRVGVSNSSLIKVGTFTYDATTEIKYTSIVLEGFKTDSSYDCIFYPMLMKNTYTADVAYEQYGASPSPDYPSEVETVKDSVEIDVVNKNLFDGNKAVEFWRGFGAQVEFVENVFKVNTAYQSLYSKAFKIIDEVKNLTLSVGDIINDAGINARVGLCTIKEDGTISNRTVIYENQTITKNANAIYFDWSKAGAFTVKEIIVSVNENTITNDYVEHKSQTAIMPIQQEMLEGDYVADVEHHEWGKYVLTGDETNISKGDSSNGITQFNIAKVVHKNPNTEEITAKSNYFLGVKWDKSWTIDNCICNTTDGYSIRIMTSKYTTIEDFKAMLKSKYEAGTPVTIYYKLAEPLDLELTSEQKAVREQKMYTYKNITNISLSDELASVEVEYKKDIETEHNKLQNEIDEIKQLISTTETSALLLDNLQKDVESEVE